MATDSAESTDIRARLKELGERRKRNEAEDSAITEEIKSALADAEGEVSRTEAADLLQIHRTTLYRVYV